MTSWQDDLRALGPCIYACIGTDRSTGDSLGPMVGTMLVEAGVPDVWGTLEQPLHAANLRASLPAIERTAKERGLTVLAIDASLGTQGDIGRIFFRDRSVRPGACVSKDLPLVGDASLVGVVNVGGFMEHVMLQNTRLSVVYRMAQEIAQAIVEVHAERAVALGD